MKRICIIILGILAITLTGCSHFTRKHQVGTVVEVNGQSLLMSDLTPITNGLHGNDSTEVADAYIRQWATNILIAEKVKQAYDEHIEDLVKDYRTHLYAQQYEQQLIARRFKNNIAEEEVDSFYTTHSNEYILPQTIIHGALVVIPLETPDQQKLTKWMQDLTEDNLEHIEKYCYRYATSYQLFIDHWVSISQLQLWIPSSVTDLPNRLHNNKQLIFQDSLSTYVLQLTEVYTQGQPMPIDYARPKIEQVLLQQQKILFIQREREQLYEEALRFNKIKIYEN